MSDAEMLRRCADLYALGADRKDKDLWRSILAEDCVIEGPGFAVTGREANLGSIDLLGRMFRATQHKVHQVVATVDGDHASGESYCTADHLLLDQDAVLSWSIRYQDTWRREQGEWRFARRALIVDWEEVRSVTVKSGAASEGTGQ